MNPNQMDLGLAITLIIVAFLLGMALALLLPPKIDKWLEKRRTPNEKDCRGCGDERLCAHSPDDCPIEQ